MPLPYAPLFLAASNNNYLFRRFLDCHLALDSPNPEAIAWAINERLPSMAFQIIVYMILDERANAKLRSEGLSNETWPTGHLYDKRTKIVQVAYSVGPLVSYIVKMAKSQSSDIRGFRIRV